MTATGGPAAIAERIRTQRAALAAAWYENHFAPALFAQFPNDFAERAERASVEEGFLGPLLGLLGRYAETADPVCRDLYLAERRRYAPHQSGPDTLTAFFNTVVPADESLLLQGLPEQVTPSAREWLADLHAPLMNGRHHPVHMLMLGDCLLSEIQPFLMGRCRTTGIDLDVRYFYFSARMGAELSTESVVKVLEETGIELIALSFLTYEGIPLYRALLLDAPRLNDHELQARVEALAGIMRGFLLALREITDAPFLLHNVSGLPVSGIRRRLPFVPALPRASYRVVESLNRSIAALSEEMTNCIPVDERGVAERHGLKHCAQPLVPDIARGAEFHPTRFGAYVADQYVRIVESYVALKGVKLLLLDFDNTLWDGVMADGPVIQHHDRQQLLQKLKEAGILLAAVSKNTESNIRWTEMTLQPDDFVSRKINWNLKAQSVQEIAAELNLGLDSFVLIDDNPAERALVAGQLPKVRTMDPLDPATWDTLALLFNLPNTRETAEARARTEMYRAQAERQRAGTGNLDYPEMMKSLELRSAIGKAAAGDLDRVSELVQRTNQFNTTTIRYSRKELDDLLRGADSEIYVGDLADRFGALGIVAVVVVRRLPEELQIESFVMSCRAMGFGMEQLMLSSVTKAEGTGLRVTGRFLPTDRNEPASTVFRDGGFHDAGDGRWALNPDDARPAQPGWIAQNGR